MKKVRSIRNNGKNKKLTPIAQDNVMNNIWHDSDNNLIDSAPLLLEMLIPATVKEFFRQLEDEVQNLCGSRYSRLNANRRHGSQQGSIYLGGRKISIVKPRIRARDGAEKNLEIYENFQSPDSFDEKVFAEGLKKVSQRDYVKGSADLANSFGMKKSTVSKAWKRATAKELTTLVERDLSLLDIISVFIDGKRFSSHGVVVALGVSTSGRKFVLGAYQASTENSTTCLALLNDLEKRGLPTDGLLFIVDGGSGINKALELKYDIDKIENRKAIRVRCHVHKLRNIVDALGKDNEKLPEIAMIFNKMRLANTLTEANNAAEKLEKILEFENKSALASFHEAKADLLVIHTLGLSMDLKKFFSTTNPIESVNSITEEDLRRVKRWRNSDQFLRWLAASALNAEKRMRKIKGHKKLEELKIVLQKKCHKNFVDEIRKVA